MAEQQLEPSSSDEALQNGSAVLNPDGQIRAAIRMMAELDKKFDAFTKPPMFRPADILQFVALVVAFIIAMFTAFGLNNRIDDLKQRQSDAERRIDGRIDGVETRLGIKIDHLGDKFGDADERLSRLEGKSGVKK